MIEFALKDYLLARAAVSAIAGTRIYAERAPQTAQSNQPRIVYLLLPGATRNYHSQGPSGFCEANIELTMSAPLIDTARALYEAVRQEIDGFQGDWGTTAVNRCTLSTPYSGSADPTQGDDVGMPAVKAVVNVFFYEAVA